MKAKPSPLRLRDFELLKSTYQFNVPDVEVIEDVKELFESYKIDIDFLNQELDNGFIQVNCMLKVNTGKKPLPGYTMEAEALGVFSLEQAENLDKKVRGNLRFYSTLNMMINNLRNIIFQQSNLGPMGGYLLPPIDVLDLFDKKNKEIQKAKSSQK